MQVVIYNDEFVRVATIIYFSYNDLHFRIYYIIV